MPRGRVLREAAEKVSAAEKVLGEEPWYPTSRKKRARYGAPGVPFGANGKKAPKWLKPGDSQPIAARLKQCPDAKQSSSTAGKAALWSGSRRG